MPTVTLSIIPHFEKDSFPGNVFSGRFTSCNDLHPSNDFSYKYNFVLLLSIFTVFKFLLFLKAEIPLDLYKSIENNFAERLAAEEENQFMIDVKWANEFLKK